MVSIANQSCPACYASGIQNHGPPPGITIITIASNTIYFVWMYPFAVPDFILELQRVCSRLRVEACQNAREWRPFATVQRKLLRM
jgi:hypothetical protein